MRLAFITIAVVLPTTFASAADRPAVDAKLVYTLYRSSALPRGEKLRIHVATFDAAESAEYNRDNCESAKSLFQTQPGVRVTYWCERGYFTAT